MEIDLYSKLANPIDAIDRIGEMFGRSGMFGCDRVEQGKVLAMVCLAERKSPTEIVRTYDIIGGKLRKKAMAAFAEFRQRGGKVKWVATGDDGVSAAAEFTFEGQTISLSYTIDQARKAGLLKAGSGWDKNPGNMLRARVISNALGMLCPEIFAGDDDTSPERPSAPLDLSKSLVHSVSPPAASPAPAPEPVIEVAAAPVCVTDDEAAEAAAGLAPQLPAPAETTPAPKPAVVGSVLPDDVVNALEEAIGEHATAAGEWMIKQGWLQAGQGLAHLTPVRAQRIIKQRDSFLRAIGGAK